MRRSISFWLVAILLSETGICRGQTVPSAYTDLYTQLSGDLTDFGAGINAVWSGSTYPVIYAGQLTDANSNNGPNLLVPASMTPIQTELLMMKAVGLKAVSVEVSFPMLYSPFLSNVNTGLCVPSTCQANFQTFYANVAAAIRAQGMKVIVESQSMMPSGLQSSAWGNYLLATFYPSLTWEQYKAARAATVAVVAATMQPDYFVLQEEPDTEASQSGQSSAGQVAGSTSMLNGSIAAARGAGVPGMKIGAGFGSWMPVYQTFANSFTQTGCSVPQPGTQPCIGAPLDFLDMHLFPIIENAIDCYPGAACSTFGSDFTNFWQNAMAIVNTANAAGIHMTMSQSWLRKVRDSEWFILPDGGDIEEAREAYSFWAPLDQSFLQIVYDLANYQGMYWVAPFNTQNLSAYLTWSSANAIQNDCGSGTPPCGTLPPSTVFSDVQAAAAAEIAQALYTSTALAWHNLIAPGDVTAPSQPGALRATAFASSISLNWNPSTDNVGVAGYQVWRGGVQVASVFAPSFQDSGLAVNSSFTYQVKAFDLASNVSPPATVSVTLPRPASLSVSGRVGVSGRGGTIQ